MTFLIGLGADINATDAEGHTRLQLATSKPHETNVKLLLSCTAETTITNHAEPTPSQDQKLFGTKRRFSGEELRRYNTIRKMFKSVPMIH